jgi:hypothetical protein
MAQPIEFDEATLVSALMSGGVIGGLVALTDRWVDGKIAVPIGMVIGILLDYKLKQSRTTEQLEMSKTYFASLWQKISGDKILTPETNAYWEGVTSSLAAVASLSLATYGFKAILGKFTTAAAVLPVLPGLPGVDSGGRPRAVTWPVIGALPLTADNLPGPVQLGTVADPLARILAPTTMQIIAAFSAPNLVRRSGVVLAQQIVLEVFRQSGMIDKLKELAEGGAEHLVEGAKTLAALISANLVNGISLRQENMHLSSERLLLIQNPYGTEAFALLQPSTTGQVEAVPAITLPFDEWRTLYDDYANRLNITPIHDTSFDKMPELPEKTG